MISPLAIATSIWLILTILIGIAYVLTIRTPATLASDHSPAVDRKIRIARILMGMLGAIGLVGILLASMYEWPRALDSTYLAFFVYPILNVGLAALVAMMRLRRIGRVL